MYYRYEAKNLARQKQIDVRKSSISLSQPELNYFFGYTKALSKMTRSRIYDVDNANYAMSMTAIVLSDSTSLSENTEPRNVLQKKYWSVKDKI